jgi:CheY-like chemotaxis protein
MKPMPLKLRPILLVEDVDTDYEAMLRRLKNLNIEVPVHRCAGVDEAHAHLSQWTDGTAQSPLPAILVLDLKLPDGDGQELLMRMQSEEKLKHIPVVVWSAVSDPTVKDRCLARGASDFRSKTADSKTTDASIDSFVHLWRKVLLA